MKTQSPMLAAGLLGGAIAAIVLAACGGSSSASNGTPGPSDDASSDVAVTDGAKADTGGGGGDAGRDAGRDALADAGSDAPADGFDAGPVKPATGGIFSVGSVPADGGGVLAPNGKRIAIKDDGFEWGSAACSDGGAKKICVTGSLTP